MTGVFVREESGQVRRRLRHHLVDLIRLAGPVIVARAGLLVMAMVDAVMVGRYATGQLAVLSIGQALISPPLVTGIGLLLGTGVMTANALGREDLAGCGAVWLRSLPYAAALGLIGLLVSSFGESILRLSGQSDELARGGGEVMLILGLGLPAALLYTTTVFFLEGVRRPLPGMVAMIAANLVNLLLNWLLVYGRWGLPELGAAGSAWATTLVRCGLAVGVIAYVWSRPDLRRFAVRRWPGWRWRDWAVQRRIGYGGGTSYAIETVAFTVLSLFAGWLGEVELAAFSAVLNLIAMIFMVAVGLGAATAVRVGIAHGRQDRRDLVLAGWTGLGANSAAMAACGAVMLAMPETLAGIYTSDPALLAVAGPLVAFAAWLVVADGGQTVMASALRGRGDALMPTVMHLVSYIVVMVPLSWLLAFPLDRTVLGLYEGILIASIVSVSLLAGRFQLLAARDRRDRTQR